MTPETGDSYDYLLEMPVTELDLSAASVSALARLGVIFVGDCIEFYRRGADATLPSDALFVAAMIGEVKQNIIEHGYWKYVGRPPSDEE
jgi:hypothetical protein